LEEIVVNTGGSESSIYAGYSWECVEKLLPEKAVIIITDNNVFNLYGDRFPACPVLRLEPGEKIKQLSTIGYLAEELLKSGIDRSGFILGIGGGVICDITGFLASVFMRGVSFGFVSTSLLSQVDASTGGKNGVNLGEIKNVCMTSREFVFRLLAEGIMPDNPVSAKKAEFVSDNFYISGVIIADCDIK